MATKLVVMMTIVVTIAVAGAESASTTTTPNSWFSCMQDCPKYHCQTLGYLPIGAEAACQAYCGTLCSIPPKAKTSTVAVAEKTPAKTSTVAAAANTPNSWFSCMQDCPKYHCQALGYLPIGAEAACQAYCGTLCAIPPKAKTSTVAVAEKTPAKTSTVAAAANTPNSWFSCMQDCPKYHCQALGYLPIGAEAACQAYCGTLCAIPPKANTLNVAADVVDRFCKLGCLSSKCTGALSSMLGTEAVKGCIDGCSDICTSSSSITTSLVATI